MFEGLGCHIGSMKVSGFDSGLRVRFFVVSFGVFEECHFSNVNMVPSKAAPTIPSHQIGIELYSTWPSHQAVDTRLRLYSYS